MEIQILICLAVACLGPDWNGHVKIICDAWWRYQMGTLPRYWPFVRGINRSLVNSPNKGQWRGTLMFPFICAYTNGRVNNRDAGDLRRHRAHYDVTLIEQSSGCLGYCHSSCASIISVHCVQGIFQRRLYCIFGQTSVNGRFSLPHLAFDHTVITWGFHAVDILKRRI